MADALAIHTAALAMTISRTPSLLAVFAHEALVAHTLPIHTAALAMAVAGAGEL
jgi:hypothetical protein